MIQLDEEQLEEYNNALYSIDEILTNTTNNPMIMLSILDSVRVGIINGKIVQLPKIFKSLNIQLNSMRD